MQRGASVSAAGRQIFGRRQKSLAGEAARKNTSFLAPIRSQNGGDRLELVWQDIVPRGSSRRSLLFFVPYFPARLGFSSFPLSAPGSPRMKIIVKKANNFHSTIKFNAEMSEIEITFLDTEVCKGVRFNKEPNLDTKTVINQPGAHAFHVHMSITRREEMLHDPSLKD